MKKKFNQVYQFKVTLKHISPPIWRRIQVPETYTFYDLHVAIQNAMGWTDSHLHQFEMVSPLTGRKGQIGEPDEEFEFDYELLLAQLPQLCPFWDIFERDWAEFWYYIAFTFSRCLGGFRPSLSSSVA